MSPQFMWVTWWSKSPEESTDSELWKWQITSCYVYVYVYGMNFLSKTKHRSASVMSFTVLTLADVFCIEGSFISKVFSWYVPSSLSLPAFVTQPFINYSNPFFVYFGFSVLWNWIFHFLHLFFCWLFWIRQYDLCLSSTCLRPAWDLPASFC